MFTTRRSVTIILALLVVAIQYPLWFGKGGWMRVWDLKNQLAATEQHNQELKARNARLASDIKSLQEGDEAIEDRARSELAMIKRNEVFVQLLDAKTTMPDEAEQKPIEKSQKAEKPRKQER
ncbi:MAG: cell division protein FtsB [Oxalobacter sp.]|nr:cell division protein FtsB [Oxalobacter sp.]